MGSCVDEVLLKYPTCRVPMSLNANRLGEVSQLTTVNPHHQVGRLHAADPYRRPFHDAPTFPTTPGSFFHDSPLTLFPLRLSCIPSGPMHPLRFPSRKRSGTGETRVSQVEAETVEG